nr:uncharacterized protein LOC133622541 [Nerophis lumbriciformis]
MMLQRATKDRSDKDGICIRYRTNGSLFNLRHLQAQTKTREQLIQELLFDDDATLITHRETALGWLLPSWLSFSCSATASLRPQIASATVEWFQNDKVVKQENKWSLQFVAAEVKHDAFRCNVSNRVSSMSSDSRVQNCTGSIFPEKLFGMDFKIMVSILAAMGGLALLLIIILIVCCVRAAVGKQNQVNEEEELRLGWSKPEPQRGRNKHPPECHQHRHQQAGQTGPQQPRRKRRCGGSQHLVDRPQSGPGRLAQANTPMANEENPPPVPQPRKKVAAQRM